MQIITNVELVRVSFKKEQPHVPEFAASVLDDKYYIDCYCDPYNPDSNYDRKNLLKK